MSSGLGQVPFDIIHGIGSQLDTLSYESLAKSCKQQHRNLQDGHTAKKALQAVHSHNHWVQLALSPPTGGFRQTLGRINDCQTALQQASPYSICIIASASSFAYSLGILCYTTCDSLRILNFNDRRATEKVFEASVLVNYVVLTQRERMMLDLESLRSMRILEHADDITVLFCDFGNFGQYVFAIDISDAKPLSRTEDGRHPRVRLCVPVRSPNKLFVRHNKQFLVMGSHSATGSHGHHEWLLHVFDLSKPDPTCTQPLQLLEFYGSEIGSTVCFIIHDGYFYSVTNQTSMESEEVDWTSFYHLVKFRLDDPKPELTGKVIWRRQHVEGPINDAWTDLGFQIDQCTGELLIVECRKEWVNGGSRSIRTYYTQSLDRVELKDMKDGMRHPPTQDRLISTLDENSNSRYEEPQERIDRYVHAEYPAVNEENVREYIRAKTKWNAYNFNAQSFVDLVTDEFVPEGEWRPRQRIRLRIVSRRELCPMIRDERLANTGTLIIRPRKRSREGEPLEDGERAFSQSQVYLWPPDNAPQELHEVLCPGGRTGEVKAVLGDEGIIYMAGPANPDTSERALVFICFDPTFGFNGMKRLDGTFAVPKRELKRKNCSVEANAGFSTTRAEDQQLTSPALAERTKKLKLEADNGTRISTYASSSMPADEKPEPDLPIPAQGDVTAQALGLDPEPALVSQAPDLWPPPLQSVAVTPGSVPEPETNAGPSGQQDKGKGKSRARSPPPHNLTTWRENASYLTINKGFWLR
ncbi:hypothetical protein H2200_012381 [Cladophialophora chaetospira]|uniref:F-box domain-containing protein n=1 Tax=Cladophialophora chaetospira TaxID=386627 RepID=A0AA38WXQ0_9EURO|nr:hypothetical protein H2200_012381 [Cladophialophora chaetospira]